MNNKNISSLPNNDSTEHVDAPLQISNSNQIILEDEKLLDNYIKKSGLEFKRNTGSNPRKNGKWSMEEVRQIL